MTEDTADPRTTSDENPSRTPYLRALAPIFLVGGVAPALTALGLAFVAARYSFPEGTLSFVLVAGPICLVPLLLRQRANPTRDAVRIRDPVTNMPKFQYLPSRPSYLLGGVGLLVYLGGCVVVGLLLIAVQSLL